MANRKAKEGLRISNVCSIKFLNSPCKFHFPSTASRPILSIKAQKVYACSLPGKYG